MTVVTGSLKKRAKQLMRLADERFGPLVGEQKEPLRKLFDAVVRGELADFSDPDKDKNDPACAKHWGPERTLPAEHVAWLCTDAEAASFVTHRGLWIRSVWIDGELDLSHSDMPFPIRILSSAIPKTFSLQQATVRAVDLSGTWTGAITASGVKVAGCVILGYGFHALGEVLLLGAEIGHDVVCSGGEFRNENRDALSAGGAEVRGSVFLDDGFVAVGKVLLLDAKIGGTLDCTAGNFCNDGDEALTADRAEIGGSVFLCDGFTSSGLVRLVGARIGGALNCNGGHLRNEGKTAIRADRTDLKGGASFLAGKDDAGDSTQCIVDGEVRLTGATIGGKFACRGALFRNEGKKSLAADGANVLGDVILDDGFVAVGEVDLIGATISGDLKCSGGKFRNNGKRALTADRVDVAGSVFLREGFAAEGEVRLLGATIGGDLSCSGSKLYNKADDPENNENYALTADRVDVAGSVFLRRGFTAEGEVRLPGAKIGGDLKCECATFHNGSMKALNADGATIRGDVLLRSVDEVRGIIDFVGAQVDGNFAWTDVPSSEGVKLDLRSAKIGTLWDDENSWPAKGNLHLHGLVYDQLDARAPTDAAARLRWLGLQPDFEPQPYEQLANVLRAGGHEAAAKKILYARAHDQPCKELDWPAWLWYWVSGFVIGHGYQPWRAFWLSLIIVVIGGGIFWAKSEQMTPTNLAARAAEKTTSADPEARDGGETQAANNSQPAPRDKAQPSDNPTTANPETPGGARNNSPNVPDRHSSADVQTAGAPDKVRASYSTFHPLMYSLDVFVPVVNFRQADHWRPDCLWLWTWLWTEIALGWFLSTLLVVGVSGLVRT